jgi:hypothetical protein
MWCLIFVDISNANFFSQGIGRELGEAALDNYLQTKTVSIRLGDAMFG